MLFDCYWLQPTTKQLNSRVRHGLAMGHTLLDFKTETTARTCGADRRQETPRRHDRLNAQTRYLDKTPKL
jgi:hypothetical protein